MDFKAAVLFMLLMAQKTEISDLQISKEKFMPGEEICFVFINRRHMTVQLPSPAPWMIVDEQGGTIFSPLTTQMIVNVEPAGKKKWCWDQRRNDGQRVEPGMYVIKMNAYIENEKQGFSKRIEIGR